MKTLATIAAIMMMSIATANAQRNHTNGHPGGRNGHRSEMHVDHRGGNNHHHHNNYYGHGYGHGHGHDHFHGPAYGHTHLIVRNHTHYIYKPMPLVGVVAARIDLPLGYVSTRLLVNIPNISTMYDTRIGLSLPRYIQVVNEYAIGGRRNYIKDADLSLEVRQVGHDILGKAQYVVDLVDLHAINDPVVASWVVENRHSDVRWDIEDVLDNNRNEIQQIVREWDYRHMQYVA